MCLIALVMATNMYELTLSSETMSRLNVRGAGKATVTRSGLTTTVTQQYADFAVDSQALVDAMKAVTVHKDSRRGPDMAQLNPRAPHFGCVLINVRALTTIRSKTLESPRRFIKNSANKYALYKVLDALLHGGGALKELDALRIFAKAKHNVARLRIDRTRPQFLFRLRVENTHG